MKIKDSDFCLGTKKFSSRLLIGTGKYKNNEQMHESIIQSKCEIVTVAVRRIKASEASQNGLMNAIDWEKIWMLPNTAGCTNAALARSERHSFTQLQPSASRLVSQCASSMPGICVAFVAKAAEGHNYVRGH